MMGLPVCIATGTYHRGWEVGARVIGVYLTYDEAKSPISRANANGEYGQSRIYACVMDVDESDVLGALAENAEPTKIASEVR